MSFMHERSKSPGLIGEWSATRTFEPGSRFSRSRSDIHATEFGSASISSDHDVNGRSQYDGSARQASIKQSQGRIQSALPVYLLWATVGGPAPGFQAKGVLVTTIDFTRLQIPAARRATFQRELLERIRAMAGVDAAANTNIVPLSGAGWGNAVWVDGHARNQRQNSNFSSISPDYFNTLHIPMVAGRDFSERDTMQSPRVAIVNEAFARKLGLGANAIGARFWREATPSSPEQLNEIVGVVKDSKYIHIRRPPGPIAYLASAQDGDTDNSMRVLVRSRLPMDAEEQAIRQTLHDVSSGISFEFKGLEDQIQESLLADRLLATLSGFFGALAVILTMTGLYGVMSYAVTERTLEIGIRMALGAQRANITAMILGKATKLLAAGLVLGAGLSLIAAGAAGALLFGLKPRDPFALAGAALLLAAVTVVASLVPSLRAANVNPLDSLRAE